MIVQTGFISWWKIHWQTKKYMGSEKINYDSKPTQINSEAWLQIFCNRCTPGRQELEGQIFREFFDIQQSSLPPPKHPHFIVATKIIQKKLVYIWNLGTQEALVSIGPFLEKIVANEASHFKNLPRSIRVNNIGFSL